MIVPRWREDREVWEVKWREPGGQRRSRLVTRKKWAQELATELNHRLQTGGIVDLNQGTIAAAEFVEDYWRDHAVPSLEPRTREVYARVWAKWLQPRIGHRALRELTPARLQQLRADLARAGAGEQTILKAYTVLGSLLGHAVVEGHLEHNPVRDVRKPRQPQSRQARPLPPATVEDVRARLNLRDATLVSVLAYGGLRPEEAPPSWPSRTWGSAPCWSTPARPGASVRSASSRRWLRICANTSWPPASAPGRSSRAQTAAGGSSTTGATGAAAPISPRLGPPGSPAICGPIVCAEAS